MSGTADGWKGRIGWIRPSSADRSLEDFVRMTPVAVGTPFRAEQNAHVQRYLEQAGFAVTAIAGYPAHTPADIRALGAETPYLLGKQVFTAQAGAEAVFLPCSTWRGATDAIARLE